MKHSITSLVFAASLFTFSLLPSYVHPQDEIDAEEYLGLMSVTLTDNQLDELSYLLPWNIKVYSYAYGDFSDDGKVDVVVALREANVTPEHTLDVYYLENINDDSYKLIKKSNIKWIELPVEVAFLAKDGICYATNRDNSNWYFTGYKISSDNLIQVNKETFPIGVEKAGDNGDN